MNTVGASRWDLIQEAYTLIGAIAADYRMAEELYTARRVVEINLKLENEKPRKWWHLGRSRRYVTTSGINIGDGTNSVILYDGTLAKACWKESVSRYNGRVSRYLDHYSRATFVWYDDDELQMIIEKLAPATDK